MHGFTNAVVSSKRKRHITDPTTTAAMRQIFAYPSYALYKINGIFSMFLHSCTHRKNIQIKNDVFRRKLRLVNQQLVRSLSNFNTSLEVVGLPYLIKSHYNYSSPIPLDFLGLGDKDFFTFF